MPYLSTSQEWLQQSSLLLQARPTTTRITSKYNVVHPTKAKKRLRPSKSAAAADSSSPTPVSEPPTQLASFVLKTFDPESGACLKYRTSKAAEVGRLIACLGKLARSMAALPEVAEDVTMLDAPEQGTGTHTPAPEASAAAAGAPSATDGKPTQGVGGGGGGGKKKKKGKK